MRRAARVPDIDTHHQEASKLIAAENARREYIYEYLSRRGDEPLAKLQRRYAGLRREHAFLDEWLQYPDGRWYQK